MGRPKFTGYKWIKAKFRARLANRTVMAFPPLGMWINRKQALELIGDLDDAIAHFQAKFKEGMSWDNPKEWTVDHVKPLNIASSKTVEEVRARCHYSNIQPLWPLENWRKGAK